MNDNPSMAEKAEQFIDGGKAQVTIEVIAKVVYVLKGVYSLDRKTIASTIKEFLELVECTNREILNQALDSFAEYNLDFVDCVLYAYHLIKGAEIATFDKKLLKLASG